MEVGILTFHWATNYGAILQAYALQTYLQKMGHTVYIINYRPKWHKKNLLKCFYTKRFWLIPDNISEYLKEKKLEVFRKKYLNETALYESLDKLKKNPPDFDAYICGSDQIWNPWFTTCGEGKPTAVYFLDFGDQKVKKIAYAVSFGCITYPDAAAEFVKKYLSKFNHISVRENSGLEILSKLDFRCTFVLPDPTLLIDLSVYSFINLADKIKTKIAFEYILRKENHIARKIENHIRQKYIISKPNTIFKEYSMEEWVMRIKNAALVITNSYHGMIFSILSHVPFVVILSEGTASGMNDRFNTLLNQLELKNRAITKYDMEQLNALLSQIINWDFIDNRLEELRLESKKYFQKALSGY